MTDSSPEYPASFRTTRWSLVGSARSEDAAVAKAALDELCCAYWSPLYAFLRREGHDEHRAMDLVQGFLARILEKGDVGRAKADRGRFRSYLLGALKHYVSNQNRDAGASKRGGDQQVLSLEVAAAEGQYASEAIGSDTPEQAFDRKFALALLGDRRPRRVPLDDLSGDGEGGVVRPIPGFA